MFLVFFLQSVCGFFGMEGGNWSLVFELGTVFFLFSLGTVFFKLGTVLVCLRMKVIEMFTKKKLFNWEQFFSVQKT